MGFKPVRRLLLGEGGGLGVLPFVSVRQPLYGSDAHLGRRVRQFRTRQSQCSRRERRREEDAGDQLAECLHEPSLENQFQLSTTLPDLPDSIRSKPFWKSSAGSWWLSTLCSGKPPSTSWVILYQVSYMRRP